MLIFTKQKLQVLSATSGRSRFDEPERNIERNYVVFKVHWRQIQAMICFFYEKCCCLFVRGLSSTSRIVHSNEIYSLIINN